MVQSAVFDAVNAIEGTPGLLRQARRPRPAPRPTRPWTRPPTTCWSTSIPPSRRPSTRCWPAQLALRARRPGEDGRRSRGPGGRRRDHRPARQRRLRTRSSTTCPAAAPGDWQPTAPMYAVALEPQWANLTPFAMTSPDQFRPAGPAGPDQPGMGRRRQRGQEPGQRQQHHAHRRPDADRPVLGRRRRHLHAAGPLEPDRRRRSPSSRATAWPTTPACSPSSTSPWPTPASSPGTPSTPTTPGGRSPPSSAAATAGNPAVTADPTWTPLLITPNFPEYVSGHSTFSARRGHGPRRLLRQQRRLHARLE